jgi:hypothetical protein
MFFNARSVGNKADVIKATMSKKGAVYCGISESQSYNDSASLSDAKFRWDAGSEGKPKAGSGPSRGMGAFVDHTTIKASVVETGTFVVWHRVETAPSVEGGESRPLFVGVGYFPHAQDTKGHGRANKELAAGLRKYRDIGHVVFGGDLNAHTGLNGDHSPVDEAGIMLLKTVTTLTCSWSTPWKAFAVVAPPEFRFRREASNRARSTTSSAPPP